MLYSIEPSLREGWGGLFYIHFNAPFLCAYKNPINNMKKKITISIKAIHPTEFATTAQVKIKKSSTAKIKNIKTKK